MELIKKTSISHHNNFNSTISRLEKKEEYVEALKEIAIPQKPKTKEKSVATSALFPAVG